MSEASQPAVTYPGPHSGLAKIYFENVSTSANSGLEAVHAAGVTEGIRLAREAVAANMDDPTGDYVEVIFAHDALSAIDALNREASSE